VNIRGKKDACKLVKGMDWNEPDDWLGVAIILSILLLMLIAFIKTWVMG